MTRRILVASAVVLTLLAAAPGAGAAVGTGDGGGLAVFAADAEAWGFSVEFGTAGPLGLLTSHTKASIDNSPNAAGASGLIDSGLLVGTAGEVMLGAPTPAYCESAFPGGPPEANCAAPAGQRGVQVGQAHTSSSDRPKATSTARYGRVIFNEGPPVVPTVSVNSQSTIAVTTSTESGVEAYSRVALQGVSLAGGTVRIASVHLTRTARADGPEQGSTSAPEVILSGLSIAGQAVDPGGDAVQALIDAARTAYGDRLQVSAGESVEERTPDGKVYRQTSGLVVRWQQSPDHWVRAVLGYARVMAYGVRLVADTGPDAGLTAPVPGPQRPPIEGRPAVSDGVAPVRPPAAAPASPPETRIARNDAATDVPGRVVPSARTAPPIAPDVAASAIPTTHGATTPYRRTVVRWAHPFLVPGQITSGSSIAWLITALLLFRRQCRGTARAPSSTSAA